MHYGIEYMLLSSNIPAIPFLCLRCVTGMPKIHYTRFSVTSPTDWEAANLLRTCRSCCRLVVDLLRARP